MRASIEQGMTVALVLSLGCQPAPAEVTQDGGSSEGPPPASTSVDEATSTNTSTPTDETAGTTSGSSGGAPGTGTTEPSSSSGSDDSSTGEPTDEPLGPFDTPVPVAELNAFGDEDDPSLTGDMLEIYFNSNRFGTNDVFVATRPTVDAAWDPPVPVDVVNSFSNETFPEVSADGLVLLVASDRMLATDLDVYYSYRAARDQAWSAPLPLAGAANAGSVDWGATLTPDLSRVFLCRDDGVAPSDIWVAPADLDTWAVGTAMRLDELATGASECSSTVSPSEREIFFETTRPTGLGWSIWTATREDPAERWDEPVAVDGLDTGADEIDPWLSPDRRTLWFAGGTPGLYDLYVATRR